MHTKDILDSRTTVMPAVYMFSFPFYSLTLADRNRYAVRKDVAAWGWHKASELLDAINAQLRLADLPAMTAEGVANAFPHESPYKEGTYLVLQEDGRLVEHLTPPNQWLASAIMSNGYIPAKIGIRIFKTLKKSPVLRRIAEMFD